MSISKVVGGRCRFCDFASRPARAAADALDSPWLASNNYVAMTSIGAFIPGWSLIVPREHSLNLSSDYAREEFIEFTREAVALVEAQFGQVCVFEHGSNAHQSATSCGTAHSHLHIVPFSGDLVKLSVEFDAMLSWSSAKIAEIASARKGGEYLFVANKFNGRDTNGCMTVLNEGRSQFFRQVLASALGKPELYSYRLYPFKEESIESAMAMHRRAKNYLEVA